MLISLENVTYGYTDVPVVENVSFCVNEGERVGLLGGNGEGKTTLIQLMLGYFTPDKGTVNRKNGIRIGYLEQSGGFGEDDTVEAAMRKIFREDEELIGRLRETEKKMATASDGELPALSARYESLNKRIAARDSYHYEVKIKTVLGGMGFLDRLSQNTATMSGGEKTRLKLCRLLLEEPDLLVLDEPTNHLDIKTLFWLEEYLSSFRGALFIVSHDRYFLDKLTNRTLELLAGTLVSYQGNYSKYKILREERYKTLEREYEKQQEEIAKLQDYVDRNIVRATTAKSAQSRVKQLDRMELLQKPVLPPPPPRFRFTYEERPYERVLRAEKFQLTAGGKTLLRDAEFTLMRGEKCALLGENGTGKSTLLKYFLSKNPAVQLGRFVKIAYYDQENADLNGEERVLDAFWSKYSLLSQTDARKLLAQAGLDAEDVNKKVKELSGGLKAKLKLSLLQARRGNVLFLDEPTNHLDLPAREALEEALKAFDGTVLFVSHDRRFTQAVATRIACLEDGKILLFNGGYEEYLQATRTAKPEALKQEASPFKTERDGGYRSRQERAKETQKRTRIRQIEEKLEALEAEEEALNCELAANAADYVAVQKITARLNALHAESDSLYAEYETLI